MPQPLLCATVAETTMAALRARRDATAGVDLIELRLDTVHDLDVRAALAGRTVPVIVTCRPEWEGGAFAGSEEERHRILEAAVDHEAEYVDLEWRGGFSDLIARRGGRGIVLSMHDFTGVPPDLADRIRAMRATGAEVVKVAVMASRLRDLVSLLELGQTGSERQVLIAMGAAGIASRILAGRFGSCWSYAGADHSIAPGQLSPERMLEEFRFRALSDRTHIYGVVGRPIGHSLSPALHNAAFAALSVDAAFVPLEAANADDFVRFAEAIGLRGASVTAPFKSDLLERVNDADPLARRVGALNTVRVDSGRWSGANTDVDGFLAPLEHRMNLVGTRAAVIGAGGAARAAIIALSSRGAQVTVYARDPVRAATVAALGQGKGMRLPPPPASWDLLVHATPVGTFPHVDETVLERRLLDGHLVYDLVYNPPRTRLMAEAEAAGCATIGGLEMLIAQAQRQCAWWTGRTPPAGVLVAAARRRLRALGYGEGCTREAHHV